MRFGPRARRCLQRGSALILIMAWAAAGRGQQPVVAVPAPPVTVPAPPAPHATLPALTPPAGGTQPALIPSVLPASAVAPPFGLEVPESALHPPAPPASPAIGSAEDRLRALEQQNARLMQQISQLSDQYDRINSRITASPQEAPLDYMTPGQFGRPRQPGADVIETGGEELPRARVDLSQGVRIFSPDGRYRIEFHDLTQGEFRAFANTGDSQSQLHSSFAIPRQRFYFTGQVDKYFDFYTVLNRGYGSLDVLDSFVNFKFDTAFNFRIGRTKVPYTYEYYKIAEGDLVGPERSVFVGNLSPNRQIGAMAYGRLLDEQVEYAAGIFNGPHHSFQDFNNFKNPFFFLNTKPFLYGSNDFIRHLNFGGSFNFGREDDPLEPTALHTANDETITSAAYNVSPAFMKFNPSAVERGATAFWSGDITWYCRSMTALINYTGGYMTYALPTRSNIQVPYEGYSVAFTYFLTGEEIVTRKEVEPLRPFNFRSPFKNPGAIEAYSRIGRLNAGNVVYSSGLVDPKLWSRDATVIDTGFNWYMNRFVRIFIDWQHAEFGSPVQLGTNRFTRSTDLFWLRSQIYY